MGEPQITGAFSTILGSPQCLNWYFQSSEEVTLPSRGLFCRVRQGSLSTLAFLSLVNSQSFRKIQRKCYGVVIPRHREKRTSLFQPNRDVDVVGLNGENTGEKEKQRSRIGRRGYGGINGDGRRLDLGW